MTPCCLIACLCELTQFLGKSSLSLFRFHGGAEHRPRHTRSSAGRGPPRWQIQDLTLNLRNTEMAIKKQEFYEGAALHLLARSGGITSIRYDPPLFIVNNRLLV